MIVFQLDIWRFVVKDIQFCLAATEGGAKALSSCGSTRNTGKTIADKKRRGYPLKGINIHADGEKWEEILTMLMTQESLPERELGHGISLIGITS